MDTVIFPMAATVSWSPFTMAPAPGQPTTSRPSGSARPTASSMATSFMVVLMSPNSTRLLILIIPIIQARPMPQDMAHGFEWDKS